MSNDDAGYDKGLQDGWSEAVRASGGRASVPMAKSGTSGPEYRKGLLKGFMEAAEEKVRSSRQFGRDMRTSTKTKFYMNVD